MIGAAVRRFDRWWRKKTTQWDTESRASHGVPLWITTNGLYGTHDELFERVDAALELIDRHQPWRMRRVRRDVARIWLHRQTHTRASYRPDVHAAILDTYFVSQHPAEAVAASIVHEAVHGRIAKRPLRKRDRVREERLCRRAEVSLGRALPNGAAVVARALPVMEAEDPEDVAPTVDYVAAAREQKRIEIRELNLPGWLERWLIARVR